MYYLDDDWQATDRWGLPESESESEETPVIPGSVGAYMEMWFGEVETTRGETVEVLDIRLYFSLS